MFRVHPAPCVNGGDSVWKVFGEKVDNIFYANSFAQNHKFIGRFYTIFNKVFTSFFIFTQSVLLLIYTLLHNTNNNYKFI